MNIAPYGALNAPVNKPQPIDMDAAAGIIFTGLFSTRLFDALELQAKCHRLIPTAKAPDSDKAGTPMVVLIWFAVPVSRLGQHVMGCRCL